MCSRALVLPQLLIEIAFAAPPPACRATMRVRRRGRKNCNEQPVKESREFVAPARMGCTMRASAHAALEHCDGGGFVGDFWRVFCRRHIPTSYLQRTMNQRLVGSGIAMSPISIAQRRCHIGCI